MDPAQQHHERLRAATDDAHQRLAALLAASRLVERSGGALWVGPLGGALAAIDAAIAPLAAPPRHTAVAAAWPAYAELAAPLVSGAGRRPHGPGALSDELRLRALVVGWLARHAARGEPAALLGALYALAGTLRTLRAGAAAGPWGDPAPAWRAFEASVSAAPLEGGALAQAAATAQAIAGELVGLVASLDRRDPRRLSQLVGVLNPAAGNHAIPDTIEEIQAAVQAGERSWAAFPYYRLRYAARGVRYTWSDSAWLVTLCHSPQAEVDRQIAWLGGLLATRGMPRWLLEHHLELLHDELARAFREREAHYAPLARAAAWLRAERLAHAGAALGDELAAAFDALLGPARARLVPGAARLVAAAVADERAQIAGALAGLLEWLAEPTRFPPDWVAAVGRIVALAQERAASAPPPPEAGP